MKNGKFVYKNVDCMNKMHEFYDRTLASLDVPYTEDWFDTSFGRTHCLLAGSPDRPKICTIHGGNGISTLNLKLFLPLLSQFSILAPDVIGMPGKSAPYRNISSGKDEYGQWIKEVLDHFKIGKISFAVSSYSASMFLSLAKNYPERAGRSLLLVPSGIAHGPVFPMIGKMIIPFVKYYFKPSEKTLDKVIEVMGGETEAIWREFFDLMMRSCKMEMRPPREYGREELASFGEPLLIIASDHDIFFPADRVFSRAEKIFKGPLTMVRTYSRHLPPQEAMAEICRQTAAFFGQSSAE